MGNCLYKLAPFATSAAVLGVEVDCSRAHEGEVLVRNKEGRASEVVAVLRDLVKKRTVAHREFARVMGRVQYADAQVMGRTGRLAMSEIRTWMRQSKGDLFLPPESVKAYEFLIRRFEVSVPRVVPCDPKGKVAYIFTDGASEMSGHTVGGVLYLEASLLLLPRARTAGAGMVQRP